MLYHAFRCAANADPVVVSGSVSTLHGESVEKMSRFSPPEASNV